MEDVEEGREVASAIFDDEVPCRAPKMAKGGWKLRIVAAELAEIDFEFRHE